MHSTAHSSLNQLGLPGIAADTPAGAKASACFFSLIETAKANGIEPSVYINYVVANIATADTDEALDALLPWNMS